MDTRNNKKNVNVSKRNYFYDYFRYFVINAPWFTLCMVYVFIFMIIILYYFFKL
jgi:hypothetical protein